MGRDILDVVYQTSLIDNHLFYQILRPKPTRSSIKGIVDYIY